MVVLERHKSAILEELASVPVVDLDWFLSSVLPEDFGELKMKNDWDLGDVLNELISKKAWKNGRWRAFPKNLQASGLREDKAFTAFREVVEAIVNVVGRPKTEPRSRKIDKRTSSYISQPNTAPVSERDNKSRPHGFFALATEIRANEASKWGNVVVPLELKRLIGTTSITDNDGKIIWSMHHIMREDARRRFTFGITIEDVHTRFWFASRSVILVTKSFDFMTDPKPLIRMVNFLTYASEEQLGYDTTMRRIQDSAGQDQLVIDIGDRKFQTDTILADFAADSLLGRGTRVWRGFFRDAPSEKLVLKDFWVELDRGLEGDILGTLRANYSKLPVGPGKHNFDDYFLTVITHGTILAGGAEDNTQAMLNDQAPPTNHKPLILTDHITESARRQQSRLPSRAASFGLAPPPQEIMRVVPRDIKWRRHYRIVFKEVAKPLYQVFKLEDHLKALRDMIIGIEILHELGHVHRDVSSGNVLFYGDGGKLSDLEYCKPFGSGGGHDGRTGTINSMSVEVAARLRLFQPSDGYGRGPDGTRHKPPFQFFILHDVESVWWLLVFALFNNSVKGEPSDMDREDRQRANAGLMFPTSLTSNIREHIFTHSGQFEDTKNSLPSVLHPLFDKAEELRARLVGGFRAAEETVDLDQTVVPPILSHFRRVLTEAIKLSENITLVPSLESEHNRSAEPSQPVKRKQSAKRKKPAQHAKVDGEQPAKRKRPAKEVKDDSEKQGTRIQPRRACNTKPRGK